MMIAGFQVITTAGVAFISGIIIGVCGGGGVTLYNTWWVVAGLNLHLFDITESFTQLQIIGAIITFVSHLYVAILNFKHGDKKVVISVAMLGFIVVGSSTYVFTQTANTVPYERCFGAVCLGSLIIKQFQAGGKRSKKTPEETTFPRFENYCDVMQIYFTFTLAGISKGLVGAGTAFVTLLIFHRNYERRAMVCLLGVFYTCGGFMSLLIFAYEQSFTLEMMPLYVSSTVAVIMGASVGNELPVDQSAFRVYLSCIVFVCGWSALLTATKYAIFATLASIVSSVSYIMLCYVQNSDFFQIKGIKDNPDEKIETNDLIIVKFTNTFNGEDSCPVDNEEEV